MPLTAAQRRHFERRLLEERERLTQSLARYAAETHDTVRDETGELSAFPSHPADLGTDTTDQELDASNAARQTAELAEIDAALERLYQRPAEYGRCERGGDEIPLERLEALPSARTCLKHAG
jgi:RNA polymerase-binding transcription factor DksA